MAMDDRGGIGSRGARFPCGHENPPGNRFCDLCGISHRRCPRCEAPNRDDAKFCGACGVRLAGDVVGVARPAPSVPSPRPDAVVVGASTHLPVRPTAPSSRPDAPRRPSARRHSPRPRQACCRRDLMPWSSARRHIPRRGPACRRPSPMRAGTVRRRDLGSTKPTPHRSPPRSSTTSTTLTMMMNGPSDGAGLCRSWGLSSCRWRSSSASPSFGLRDRAAFSVARAIAMRHRSRANVGPGR